MWAKVWLPDRTYWDLQNQCNAIVRLLNADVLAYDLKDQLGEALHVLSAVASALANERPDC